jgi:hypothetical protein
MSVRSTTFNKPPPPVPVRTRAHVNGYGGKSHLELARTVARYLCNAIPRSCRGIVELCLATKDEEGDCLLMVTVYEPGGDCTPWQYATTAPAFSSAQYLAQQAANAWKGRERA